MAKKEAPAQPAPPDDEIASDPSELEGMPEGESITWYLYRVRSNAEMVAGDKGRTPYVMRWRGPFDLEMVRGSVGGGCFLIQAYQRDDAGRLVKRFRRRFDIDGPPKAAGELAGPEAGPVTLDAIAARLESLEAALHDGTGRGSSQTDLLIRALEIARQFQPQQPDPAGIMQQLLSVFQSGLTMGQAQERGESNLYDLAREILPPVLESFTRSALPAPAPQPAPLGLIPGTGAPARAPAERAQLQAPAPRPPENAHGAQRERQLIEVMARAIREDRDPEQLCEAADLLLNGEELTKLAHSSPSLLASALIGMYPQLAPSAEHYLTRFLSSLREMLANYAQENAEPPAELDGNSP